MSGSRSEGGTSANIEVEFFSADESAPRRTRHLILPASSTISDLRAKLASLHAENLIIGRPTLYRIGPFHMDLSRGTLPLAPLLTDGHQLRCRYVVETWPQLLVQEAGGPSSFVVPFALAQTVAQLKTALQFISGIDKQHMLLVLNNRVLHEQRTLVSYHIQRFTVLTLIRRDRLASAA